MKRNASRELALNLALDAFRVRCQQIVESEPVPAKRTPLYRDARAIAVDEIYECMRPVRTSGART